MTKKIISAMDRKLWGAQLHKFVARNPKYAHLLNKAE
ncbi:MULTISPECIES: hypothetical protein [Rummeliibacillus]|nr:hypothetical protein [Rummeliibacillus suwonensis]